MSWLLTGHSCAIFRSPQRSLVVIAILKVCSHSSLLQLWGTIFSYAVVLLPAWTGTAQKAAILRSFSWNGYSLPCCTPCPHIYSLSPAVEGGRGAVATETIVKGTCFRCSPLTSQARLCKQLYICNEQPTCSLEFILATQKIRWWKERLCKVTSLCR